MIEVVVPQDISEHKAKFIGNLTTRQVACAMLGIFLAVIMYFIVLENIENRDVKIMITAISVTPFVLIGFVNLYGLPFEKIAPIMLMENYLCPPKRFNEIHHPEFEKFEKTRIWEIGTEETLQENKKYKKKENSSKKTKVIPSAAYPSIK